MRKSMDKNFIDHFILIFSALLSFYLYDMVSNLYFVQCVCFLSFLFFILLFCSILFFYHFVCLHFSKEGKRRYGDWWDRPWEELGERKP